MLAIIPDLIEESWNVLARMSPYLLFGFLVAGIISVWLRPEWVERHLGGKGIGPVFQAALFGVPLPLCSCGVIPVGASIRRQGAGRPATVSFLLSTPQTGVDSIAVTWSILGPVFAVFRPLIALASGLLGGGLVAIFEKPVSVTEPSNNRKTDCGDSCRNEDKQRNPVRRMLEYGLITLPRDIGRPLLIGVVIAGAITALIPPGSLGSYLGRGVWSILLLMAAGIPIYVCATASVPLVAGLIYLGASPGAALAFLIAGPVSNAASFTTVWKILGRRSALIYLFTVAAAAFGGGVLLNWIAPGAASGIAVAGPAHDSIPLLYHLSAGLLLLIIIWSYFRGRRRVTSVEVPDNELISGRERVEITISGMTCPNCSATVGKALQETLGVEKVSVDLENGRAEVVGENLNSERLIKVIEGLGYQAACPVAVQKRKDTL